MQSATAKVERLLQINMAVLAAMGTLLLGMGQRSVFLPTIATLAAVTSILFTDTFKWLRLNRNIANLAAVIAVVFSMQDFIRQDNETQLLAIANLLVYLQIVLLHQEKNLRVYWQLAILSLLQVVVASALNLGIEFGLLLVLYLFTALTGLLLLFIFRESQRFRDGPQAVDEGESVVSRFMTSAAPARKRRLPAIAIAGAGLQPVDDPAAALVRWAMVREVMKMGLITLGISALVFFSVPRHRNNPWQGPIGRQQATVGFSQEVSLEQMGRMQLSDELAMRVTFRDPDTGQPMMLASDPYFRGVALSQYVGKKGRWTQGGQPTGQKKLDRPPLGSQLVIQDILLQPSQSGRTHSSQDNRVLFAVSPVYRTDETPGGIREMPFTQQLIGSDRQSARGEYRYQVATDGFRAGHQSVITPHGPYRMSEMHRRNHLHWPGKPGSVDEDPIVNARLANLRRIAAETLPVGKFDPNDVVGRARALEAHFHQPGRYHYSLDDDPLRIDSELDPLEDFVHNHHTGHCEYFASALVLMLRSQNIPARMVIGYYGGDYNSVGNFYQVRQLHAHAWVEAYLEPSQVPTFLSNNPEEDFANGAWLRLEPTPAIDQNADEQTTLSLMGKLGELVDYAQLLWNDYVLGLNSERQQESIYKPLADSLADSLHNFFSLSAWQQFFTASMLWMGWDPASWLSGEWFNWRAGLVTFAALLIVTGLCRWLAPAVRPLLGRYWRELRGDRSSPSQSRVPRVEFYRRLEQILAGCGLRRAAQTTPQEFAAQSGLLLADLPGGAAVATLPVRIVAAYYRVRFGGEALDNFESEAVEQDLSRLETTLQQIATRRGAPR